MAVDIARGLAFLHHRRVVHLDVKSPNILLDSFGAAKVADVGLSRVMNTALTTGRDFVGTFAWAAPELILAGRCTEKADIFSFGVVLWEICTGERPERGRMRDLRCVEDNASYCLGGVCHRVTWMNDVISFATVTMPMLMVVIGRPFYVCTIGLRRNDCPVFPLSTGHAASIPTYSCRIIYQCSIIVVLISFDRMQWTTGSSSEQVVVRLA